MLLLVVLFVLVLQCSGRFKHAYVGIAVVMTALHMSRQYMIVGISVVDTL
jgi:hypothetical protein